MQRSKRKPRAELAGLRSWEIAVLSVLQAWLSRTLEDNCHASIADAA
jgi:hypothetical protein